MTDQTLGDLGSPQAPPSAPTTNPYRRPTRKEVEDLYRTLLNRDPDSSGLAAHLANPQGLAGVEMAIRESDEFRNKPTAAAPGSTAGPQGTVTGPVTPGGQRTGWGFDSPTGGRKEFSYTDTDYGRDTSGFYDPHYRDTGAAWDTSDPSGYDSLKRSSYRNAAGLGERFDEAALDKWIERMRANGFNVTKVDGYQVDFHNGEGPIQIRHSSDKFWWNNRATENQPAGGGLGTLATVQPTTPPPPTSPVSTTQPEPMPSATTEPPVQTDAAASMIPNLPPPTTSTSGTRTDATSERFIERNVVPILQAQDITVVEIRGDKVRVITPEDRKAGNLEGRWVDVLPDDGGGGSLADYGQTV